MSRAVGSLPFGVLLISEGTMEISRSFAAEHWRYGPLEVITVEVCQGTLGGYLNGVISVNRDRRQLIARELREKYGADAVVLAEGTPR